jgi:hypothetical protein
MKLFFSLIVISLFCFTLTGNLMAQTAQGNVFIVTTLERAFPENGSARELDSLAQIYMDNAFKNNPYVVSYKVLRHWWGHDNRDFVRIVEVKSWDDVVKAFEEVSNQIKNAVPDKAERDAFEKAYFKYFTGKHSDEIYQEVAHSK